MINIDKVTRNYGPNVAVNGVSLQIARGEIVGLLGHNGAGKTTLMKILTGFLEPTSGTISVGGKDVVADRVGVQRHIGYLPESAPLYPEMLVQEYLLMMAELRGIAPQARREAVGKAAKATGLVERLVSPISTLSKGFRQRVGIAQAIVHSPDVLVLDEPTNGLDPVQIQSIRELIRGLGEHTTIILSTHILQEVEAVCDRVLVMIDGVLAEDSPLEDLLVSNTVHLTLAEGTSGVSERLGQLAGVQQVRPAGVESALAGFEVWAIEIDKQVTNTPGILAAGVEAGWSIGGVAPEQRTLDAVFRRLQDDHIKGREVR
jgi:ABC-2 type transport system ATP-binding protein